jgi:hypothetical protein
MVEYQPFEALWPQPGSDLQILMAVGQWQNLSVSTKGRLPKMIVTDQLEDRLNSYILGRLVIKMHLHGGGVNIVSVRNRRRHLAQRPSSMSEDESDEKGVGLSPLFKLERRLPN